MTGRTLAPALAALLIAGAMPALAQGAGTPVAPPGYDIPMSNDPLWLTLAHCKVGYDTATGLNKLEFTPEVLAMNGQTVSVSGYVLPLDGSDLTKHFILQRPSPDCLFCPPADSNMLIEVDSARAVPWNGKLVAITGKLQLVRNEEQGFFFYISGADWKWT